MRQSSFTVPRLVTLTFMAALLVLSGCSSANPAGPLATPQPTLTRLPTRRPPPTPAPTATPTLKPVDLVVVHSNDVMGYTEPCG
jgi:hypothetical protein